MSNNQKYIVSMPKNYNELIMSLNIISYLNISEERLLVFNPELNEKQKIISTKQREMNFFDKYQVGKNDMISKYLTGDNKINDTDFIRSEIVDLFFNIILKKNIRMRLKDIFSHEFSSKQLLTRQYIRKKIKNKILVLFHINHVSIKYIVYYLLVIQSLYKLDQVDENINEYKINDDYMFVLFCNENDSENENIMTCQQVHHQITLLMPEIKENIGIGNILFQEHIENSKNVKENGVIILYNLSEYISIISEQQLLMIISLFSINNANCFFPTKLLNSHTKQLIYSYFKIVDVKKIKSQEEIDGRFYPI